MILSQENQVLEDQRVFHVSTGSDKMLMRKVQNIFSLPITIKIEI
jgi:hypothetical protein